MTAEHYNELIEVSRKIYDGATEKLTNYLSARYCAVGNGTMEQQMEDYLLITIETSACFLGNALAQLDADSQEKEIQAFTEKLRRVIQYAQQKADIWDKPS